MCLRVRTKKNVQPFLAAVDVLGGCAAVLLPVEGTTVTLEAAVAEGLVAAVGGLDVVGAGRAVEGAVVGLEAKKNKVLRQQRTTTMKEYIKSKPLVCCLQQREEVMQRSKRARQWKVTEAKIESFFGEGRDWWVEQQEGNEELIQKDDQGEEQLKEHKSKS